MTTKHMAGAEHITAVVQENDMEAFMSLKDTFVAAYPLGESPWRLLHIVAVYGTAEMVERIQRWTRIDWDRQHTIHEEIFKGASRYPNVKEATALYLATCLERTEIVRSLAKLAGEENIRTCLQGLKVSNDMEHIFMVELADRLGQKHAELKPIIVPGHRRQDNGTQLRVFIVYSVSLVHGHEYDFNGLGLVKLRNPYVIKRTNSGALVSETGVKNEDAETEPDEDAHVEKSPDDDADSSNEDVDGLSNEDAKRVTEAIQTHRDCLWQTHSNLNIITGRRVKRNISGFDIHEACVILYCSTNGVIPLGEDEFPRKLVIQNGDYVNVVVHEGFFDFGGYATASGTCRHDYLKMGCEIGRSTPQFDTRGRSIRNSGGTLGPFVRFNNDLGFLSCAHVLFDIPSHSNFIDFTAAFPMVQVVQPSMNSTASVNSKECGVVERAVFDPSGTISIDATVVKITDQSRKPTAGQFANERHSTYVDAGFKELPEYNNGFMFSSAQLNALPSKPNVVKFGSRTDVTKGALGVVGADVRPYSKALGFGDSAGKIRMENQYLVTGIPPSTDFFDGGDSGSGVFCQDNNGHLVCVGMAIGHCVLDDYPYKAGIVTPIDAILQALGPNFKLATFPKVNDDRI
ncbi:uncharacterized protein [Argopecten irradians]|uniref:uncharacterized protein n=1 Tax=Argopecten irradians TaxID=31199 RepID=UPI0037198CB6